MHWSLRSASSPTRAVRKQSPPNVVVVSVQTRWMERTVTSEREMRVERQVSRDVENLAADEGLTQDAETDADHAAAPYREQRSR
jgi:hypothetical protein